MWSTWSRTFALSVPSPSSFTTPFIRSVPIPVNMFDHRNICCPPYLNKDEPHFLPNDTNYLKALKSNFPVEFFVWVHPSTCNNNIRIVFCVYVCVSPTLLCIERYFFRSDNCLCVLYFLHNCFFSLFGYRWLNEYLRCNFVKSKIDFIALFE